MNAASIPAWRTGCIGVLLFALCVPSVFGAEAASSTPPKLAVFEFELDDVTPAAALENKSTSSSQSLVQTSEAARKILAESGRYRIVDVSQATAAPVASRALRNCDGCEAAIAKDLGADQSMIGIVRRATQTDFYIMLVIRDARTGKVIDEQGANFAGSEDGWASGVRMLIRHQILITQN